MSLQLQFRFRRNPDALAADKDMPGVNGVYVIVDVNTGRELTDLVRTWDWVSNLDNYPDDGFSLLEEEYDWQFRDKTGPIYKYINCIAGNARLQHRKKNVAPRPQVFWLFARGWQEMINNPKKYRDAHKGRLYGGVVCEFINTIPIQDWFPAELNPTYYEKKIFSAIHKNRKIIPTNHSALLSRTFNGSVGLHLPEEHKLKIEDREPLLTMCKCCNSITETPGGWYEVEDEEYEEKLEQYHAQKAKRAERNKTGERSLGE